jgi:putative peptidoglycan lipid II flippase
VSRLALWAFAGLAISQLGFFITQWVLNTAAGRRPPQNPLRGTSVYGVAFTIFMLPHAFIAVSIITALFPRLSSAAAENDVPRLTADFRRGVTLPLVANVPVMVFLIVAAEPVVAMLNPGIDRTSIELAAMVLVIMVLGIVPFGVDLLCYRLFFALEDGRSPLVMQALLTGVSLAGGVLTLFLQPQWAIAVVATGQTVGNVVSSTVGVHLIRRRLGPLGLTAVLDSAARIGASAAVAGLIAWGTMTVMSPILGDPDDPGGTTWAQRLFTSGVVVSFTGVVFVTVYLGLAHVLRVREVREVADMVRRKVG